eukprot:349887-Pyramimonas_sp.AAC.1
MQGSSTSLPAVRQVDGLSPAPSFGRYQVPRRALREDELRGIWAQGGASTSQSSSLSMSWRNSGAGWS